MRGLAAKYRKTPQNPAPTLSYDTLRGWSEKFGWKERATLYDEEHEASRNERMQEVLDEGLALEVERVDQLKKLGQFLHDLIYEQGAEKPRKTSVECPECSHSFRADVGTYRPFHNVFMPDAKSLGSGEFAETIDIERFNAPLLSIYLKVFDDLAAEVGDRRRDESLQSLVVNLKKRLDISKLPQEQFDEIARGANWLEVLLRPYLTTD